MKKVLSVCFAVCVSLSTFAAELPDDVKAVQGSWKPVKAEMAGQPLPEEALKIISLKMDKDKYEVLLGDKIDKGTYKMDAAAKPKSLTIISTEGPNNGKTLLAIYELKDDTLQVCYDLSGTKRPTEFKTAAGTTLFLVTYNRKKE